MVESQPVQAPLVPLLTVPLHLLFGVGVNQSLLVIPVFFVLLVVAAYGIARQAVARWWSLLAALVVAAAPVVTDYTRLYHFAIPAAAFMAVAVWALLRSDRLSQRGFAVLAGVCVGLMLLTRTMTLSYLPGLAVAAAVLLAAPGLDLRARAINLALAVLATAVVAATWYVENWRGVYDYLFGYGYGSDSIRYRGDGSVLSLSAWKTELRTLVGELYLPLSVVLALALVALGVAAMARLEPAGGGRRSAREWLGRPSVTLLLVSVCGYVALVSSRNQGTAFGLPLLPLVVVLVIGAVTRIPWRSIRAALAVALVAVSVANVAMKSGLAPVLSDPRNARVPVVGSVPVTDGLGVVQGQLAASGYRVSPTERMPSFHRRWLAFERHLTRRIFDHAARLRVDASGYLATRHFVLTNTAMRLAAALDRRYLPVGWLEATPDTERAFAAKLRESGAQFLVAADSPPSAAPGVTPPKAEHAAESLGFRLVETLRLPDGRQVRLWYRAAAVPPSPD
jgi:hypothetical protein